MSNNSESCSDCFKQTNYSLVKNLDVPSKGPKCSDRDNTERSSKDVLDYNFYVLGKSMSLKPMGRPSPGWVNHTYRENETL